MTAMPQMVATFHSLVGAAALCLLAVAAIYSPPPRDPGRRREHPSQSLLEPSLRPGHRRRDLNGSVIAARKLNGQHERRATLLTARHCENWPWAGIVALVVVLVMSGGTAIWPSGRSWRSAYQRRQPNITIGGADMPVVVSMLKAISAGGGGGGTAALGFTLENIT